MTATGSLLPSLPSFVHYQRMLSEFSGYWIWIFQKTQPWKFGARGKAGRKCLLQSIKEINQGTASPGKNKHNLRIEQLPLITSPVGFSLFFSQVSKFHLWKELGGVGLYTYNLSFVLEGYVMCPWRIGYVPLKKKNMSYTSFVSTLVTNI